MNALPFVGRVQTAYISKSVLRTDHKLFAIARVQVCDGINRRLLMWMPDLNESQQDVGIYQDHSLSS